VQVVVGVVYNPILDELFVASKGEGATLNGRPIQASQVEALGDSLFCTEIGVTRDDDTVSAIFSRIRALCQQVCSSCCCSRELLIVCALHFLGVPRLGILALDPFSETSFQRILISGSHPPQPLLAQ
jgi:myo-inositol-1(or 4)-monophosphatase